MMQEQQELLQKLMGLGSQELTSEPRFSPFTYLNELLLKWIFDDDVINDIKSLLKVS